MRIIFRYKVKTQFTLLKYVFNFKLNPFVNQYTLKMNPYNF